MCRCNCQQTFSQENDHFFSGSGVCPWSINWSTSQIARKAKMKSLAENMFLLFWLTTALKGWKSKSNQGQQILRYHFLFRARDELKVVIALYQQSILVYMCRRNCQQTFSRENDHFFSGSGICPWSIDWSTSQKAYIFMRNLRECMNGWTFSTIRKRLSSVLLF